jgi:hypothetical protein
LSPANVVIESNLAGDSDDFDDDSWEFKDASSGIRAEDQASFIGLGEPNTKYSTKIELNDYVDFFCKLKEELHFLALCHLDNLKVSSSLVKLLTSLLSKVKLLMALNFEICFLLESSKCC